MLTDTERSRLWISIPANRTKKLARDAERRERLKKEGKCLSCGIQPARQLRTYCEACAKLSVSYLAKRGAKFAGSGRCYRCGGASPLEALDDKGIQQRLCETCYFKKRARSLFGRETQWTALRNALISQNYRCAYTGELLHLGINASVDHARPSSRFPELRCNLANIEWVTNEVNVMKRNRTPEEFIALIELILRHRQDRPSGANVEDVVSCVS